MLARVATMGSSADPRGPEHTRPRRSRSRDPPPIRAFTSGGPKKRTQESSRNVSPIFCCGRQSARASGPYSLEPLRRSVSYLLRSAIPFACRPGQAILACPLAGTKCHRHFVWFRLALPRLSVRATHYHGSLAPSRRKSVKHCGWRPCRSLASPFSPSRRRAFPLRGAGQGRRGPSRGSCALR